MSTINDTEGGADSFTRGYEKLGFTFLPSGIVYREWAPSVKEVYLTGEFSKFNNSLLHVPSLSVQQ
jgi:1,4-alpha-glucan branching enzyme